MSRCPHHTALHTCTLSTLRVQPCCAAARAAQDPVTWPWQSHRGTVLGVPSPNQTHHFELRVEGGAEEELPPPHRYIKCPF